jgi:diaminopimelate decarboxylase
MTEFELDLAIKMDFMGEDIIVNGPCKTTEFLKKCINYQVRLIVVDSIEELYHLHHLT